MKAWKFLNIDRKLRYGDGRVFEQGKTYKVDGKIILCERGIHASIRSLDALQYSPGPVVARVECGGVIVRGNDKIACSEMTPIYILDATDTLRKFARMCALDVIHLWDAPEIVVRYLKTGDESIRSAACSAARSAADYAAYSAAYYAARSAARSAAYSAAYYAACSAADYAADYAADSKQNKRLSQMLAEAWAREAEE